MNSTISPQIAKVLASELNKLEAKIRANLVKSGVSTTGTTQSILSHGVVGNYGYLAGSTWMETLEKGRGPAKGSGPGKDFLERLKRWIMAKGLPYNDAADLERLANFFHWYINRYGSKMFRLKKTRDIYTSAIVEFEKQIINNLADVVLFEITKLV